MSTTRAFCRVGRVPRLMSALTSAGPSRRSSFFSRGRAVDDDRTRYRIVSPARSRSQESDRSIGQYRIATRFHGFPPGWAFGERDDRKLVCSKCFSPDPSAQPPATLARSSRRFLSSVHAWLPQDCSRENRSHLSSLTRMPKRPQSCLTEDVLGPILLATVSTGLAIKSSRT